MPAITIELPQDLEQYVHRSVEEGRFEDASALIRSAVSSFEREESADAKKLENLRATIQHGMESGIAEGSVDEVFDRVRQRAAARLGTK